MTATQDRIKCLCLCLLRCCLLCSGLVRFRGSGLCLADAARLGLLEDGGNILNSGSWWRGLGCGLGFRCSLSCGIGFWLRSSSLRLGCSLCFSGLGSGLLRCSLLRDLGLGLGLLLLQRMLERIHRAAASSTNLWRGSLLLGDRLGFLLRNLDWTRRT